MNASIMITLTLPLYTEVMDRGKTTAREGEDKPDLPQKKLSVHAGSEGTQLNDRGEHT